MNQRYPSAPKQPRRKTSGERASLHTPPPVRRGRVGTGERAPIGRYVSFEGTGRPQRPGTRRAKP